jgi:hypothetical protein
MEANSRRRAHRLIPIGIACAILAAGAVGGCGDDGDDGDDTEASAPATLEITATETGNEAQLDVPGTAEAGLTEITLVNDGEQPHSGQLLRIEGERDADEVAEALGLAQRGEAFPDWFFAGGGTGSVAPGESATVTQQLEAGSTYWVVDDEARGEPPIEPIEITGEGDDEALPETDNVVSAVDFGFEAEDLAAGETITFKNEGEQPHHMIATPITDEDATIEDVETFFREEEGQPPVDFEQGVFTSVLEGGDEQVSAASLDSGRWALVCFISNREGGPPHIEMGMIDEVEVE